MSDKDISLDDGTELKWLSKKGNVYLNQTIIIYGRRNSGKSTIIEEIMYLCKDDIVFPFFICQSGKNDTDLGDRIPNNCIKRDITKEWLETLLLQQKTRSEMYNIANKMDNLRSLFKKIKKNNKAELLEQKIIADGENYINTINKNDNFDYAKKKSQVTKIYKVQAKKLTHLYKTNIRAYKHYLDSKKDELTMIENCVLSYLDFRPHMILIFDDCAASIKIWIKESPAIKEFFYNGRHYYTTIIITTQDDKEIDSSLRKNTMVSIFTTAQAAISNFSRSSNAYPKHEMKRAELCSKRVFRQDTPGIDNYKKLVYLQTDMGDPFCYTISDLYEDFRIGCPSLWILNSKLNDSKKHSHDDELESFFKRYHDM